MAKKPRILLWDIEASSLAADYGRILCIGYKWFGERKTHLLRIRDTKEFKSDVTNDRGLLIAFAPVLLEADMQVTWFGDGFDIPFVQTRNLMQELPPLANVPSCDAWRIARKKLKFRSNRLDGVSRAIPYPEGKKRLEKTPITPEQWIRGAAGHVESLKYIEEHCVMDVKVLEKVYSTLRPFGFTSRNLSKLRHPELEGCPHCASMRIQLRGFAVTERGRKRRAQCQDCGGWFRLPLGKTK